MGYTLVNGGSTPDEGDSVRVRVLRTQDGELVVDRPKRDRSLKLSSTATISIPADAGTYEVRGTVRTPMRAQQDGKDDSLYLNDHHVEKVADEPQRLPRDTNTPEWTHTDPDTADVDVDIDSMVPDESVVEQSTARPSRGEADSLRENLNDLLLNVQ